MRPDTRFFMEQAEAYASRSSCCKIQVGAVLVRDGRLLYAGYNGTGPGEDHCCDFFAKTKASLSEDEFLKQHALFSEQNEFHAESNCITGALGEGIKVRGASLVVTHSPCFSCAKLIVQTGIADVYYRTPYNKEAVDFLFRHRIPVIRI